MFSFETAKLEGKTFLSLTSLTVSEFEKLLVPFSKNSRVRQLSGLGYPNLQ
jgi:hypothetical protein